MRQFILGTVLLIAGILLDLIYKRMRQSSGQMIAGVSVQKVAARLKDGETANFSICASLQTEHPAASPLGGKPVAYYETKILALEGDRQKEVFSAQSEAQPYLQDAPGGEKLWVDIPSFGDAAELIPAHMETLQPGDPMLAGISALSRRPAGSEFQGYRVMEGCVPCGHPVFLRGRVQRKDGRLQVDAGVHQNARFTYQVPQAGEAKSQLSTAAKWILVIGAVAILAGCLLVISTFSNVDVHTIYR